MAAEENRALRACAAFSGDVLIVESEQDDVVPHPVIANYLAAFTRARSIRHRLIKDADHGLSEVSWQRTSTSFLLQWLADRIIGPSAGATYALE